ncbi:GNAT family N-acetyltransferase [Streptomyces flavidovirens]|uniref:GNAT family N-acetyltransferase n=1 Tax=Streptomyces flavidovirens TaxID=67298 RepID=UPI00040C1B8E|nr:GNAT family N-acetyltransferase [Streptomyces flavidovirens]
MALDVTLREVRPDDLDLFFTHFQDPEAKRMAAFGPAGPVDRARFDAHWKRNIAEYVVRTVLADGEAVGSVCVYGEPGDLQVTYWIGRAHWGRGVATAALRALLELVAERPLSARAAADNTGSLRVLEKCGFTVTGRERGFAHARGAEIDELVLTLTG